MAPIGQVALHHACVQVAGAAGGDLPHREAVARETPRVVIGLHIAGEDRDAARGVVAGERAFEQRGLAGARRTDQVEAEGAVALKALAQRGRDPVVFVENFAFERDAHQDILQFDEREFELIAARGIGGGGRAGGAGGLRIDNAEDGAAVAAAASPGDGLEFEGERFEVACR